jgi:hypothetical protein
MSIRHSYLKRREGRRMKEEDDGQVELLPATPKIFV